MFEIKLCSLIILNLLFFQMEKGQEEIFFNFHDYTRFSRTNC